MQRPQITVNLPVKLKKLKDRCHEEEAQTGPNEPSLNTETKHRTYLGEVGSRVTALSLTQYRQMEKV